MIPTSTSTELTTAAGGLEVTSADASIGETITITVNVNNAPNDVEAFGFDLTYDGNALQYQGHRAGSITEGFDFFGANDISSDVVRVGGFTVQNTIQQGDSGGIVELDFTVTGCYNTQLELEKLVDDVSSWAVSDGSLTCSGATTTTTTTSTSTTSTTITTTPTTSTTTTTTNSTTTITTPGTYACSSCSECTGKIQLASAEDTVYLTEDITDQSGNCIEFNNKQGITFDCQGNSIEGDSEDYDYGIYLRTSSGNRITNCGVSRFGSGIYLYSSDTTAITGNTVELNDYYGIHIYLSANNIITENTVNYNARGIYIVYSADNLMESNYACSNTIYDSYLNALAGNSGDDNTCNNAGGLNDEGSTGCTYDCIATTTTTSTVTTSIPTESTPLTTLPTSTARVEEKVEIPLYVGWNLISLPDEGELSLRTCEKMHALVRIQGKYYNMEDAKNILGDELNEYISKNTFWVYTFKDCYLGFEGDSYTSYDEIKLEDGWNFVPVTNDMVGKGLANIQGDYKLKRTYTWDPQIQEWTRIYGNHIFREDEAFRGIIIYAEQSSSASDALLTPPQIPT